MVCLHLWICHQSFSDIPGVAQAGDLGRVVLLGPATNLSSSYQLVFVVSSLYGCLGGMGQGRRSGM